MDLIYEKNEMLRMLGESPFEFHARTKEKLHPMRDLSFEEKNDTLVIKEGNKVLYSTKPKDFEKDLGEFLFRVLDEMTQNTSESYTFNECFAFMNFINDSVQYPCFPISIIVEPKLEENTVFIDMPCTLLQNPLRQHIRHSAEHYRFNLPIEVDRKNPIDSIINIFHQVQDFLIEFGEQFFDFYDSSADVYKGTVTGGLFYCFLLLKEQLIEYKGF